MPVVVRCEICGWFTAGIDALGAFAQLALHEEFEHPAPRLLAQ
jgi:hypothetical protein